MVKKNLELIVVLIIVSLILFLYFYKPQKDFLSIRYYDINGVELKKSLSITIPATAYYMDLTANVLNNGSVNLKCQPVSASPSSLNNALVSRNERVIKPGNSAGWTSNLLNLSQFVGKTTTFSITVQCSYPTLNDTVYISDSGSLDINVTNVCRNNICEYGESWATCPEDCPPSFVKFRTNVVQNININPFTPAKYYTDTVVRPEQTNDGTARWIAFDKNGDKIMEGYGATTSSTGQNVYCDLSTSYKPLLYMSFGQYGCSSANFQFCDVWLVNSSVSGRLGICYNDLPSAHSFILWYSTTANGASNAITYNQSLNPYTGNGQER